MHYLNPVFMVDIFCPEPHNYYTRCENLTYPNPSTVTYGLESFGYKANQIWSSIPQEIRNSDNIDTFKKYISQNCSKLCNCNLCKRYIPNLGYVI